MLVLPCFSITDDSHPIVVILDDPTAFLRIEHQPTANALIRILKPISITRSSAATLIRTVYHYHIPAVRSKLMDGLLSVAYTATGQESRQQHLLLNLEDGLVRGTVKEDGEFKWKADGAQFRVVDPQELFA